MNDSHRSAGPGPGYPQASTAWLVTAVLVVATILSYTDRQILSLLVDHVRHDLAISDTQVGLLLGTAFAVVYGIAGLPFGYLADRRSRRMLILGGIVLWSAGTILCGLAQGFGALFLARMVVGVGEAVLTPAAVSMIGDYFPRERRGTATGVFLMGIAMGAGGAIFFGGLVLRLVEGGALPAWFGAGLPPWRLVLLLLGALGLVPALFVAATREPARQPAPAAAPMDSRRVLATGYALAPLLLAVATISLVDNAVLAWAPSVLIRKFGLEPSHVGVVLGALLIAGGGGGVLAGGLLGDRARARGGRRAQLTLCLVAALVTAPLAMLVLSSHAAVVFGGVALYITSSGVGTAAGIAAILDGVRNDARGIVTAVSFFLNVALGAGVGPPAVAIVAERLLPAGSGIAPAIAIVWLAGFTLVAAAFALGRAGRAGRDPAMANG